MQSFPDVKTSHEFYEAIKYAKENNIAQGYPDGTF
ncbi:S-layer homology domain-containing protein [Candidatus Venteria ishoeyi]